MANRKNAIVHESNGPYTRMKRRDNMPWWGWLLLGLGLAGILAWRIFKNMATRNKSSTHNINSSSYVSDDEMQAIQIIRELSKMYDEVDKRKAKNR